MDFTLPNDLDVDKLSFEEIKFILDNLKVRYSIRKDTTREYLALVLKRHLSRNNMEVPALLERIRTSANKQHEQDSISEDYDYLQKIKDGRFSVSGLTRQSNLLEDASIGDFSEVRYQEIHTSEFPDLKNIDKGSIQKIQQERYSPAGSLHKTSQVLEPSDIANPTEMRGRQDQEAWRSKDSHKMRRFGGDLMNKSFDFVNRESEYDDYFEQSRNCYSDTQLLRGPIQVDYDRLLKIKEQEIIKSSVHRRLPPQNEQIQTEEQVYQQENRQNDNMRRQKESIVKALIGTIIILVLLFVIRPLLTKFFSAQRNPVVFP